MSHSKHWQDKADGNVGYCNKCGFGIWKPDFPAGECANCIGVTNVIPLRRKNDGG